MEKHASKWAGWYANELNELHGMILTAEMVDDDEGIPVHAAEEGDASGCNNATTEMFAIAAQSSVKFQRRSRNAL